MAVEVYESVKAEDDIEVALIEAKPSRKHKTGEQWRKLKHYAVYSSLMVLALVMQSNYVAYKLYLYCMHPGELVDRPWLILLLLCECVYLFTAVLTAADHLVPPSSRPDLGLLNCTGSSPTVDILIPTCKEPTDVPVEAVKAALAMDYPADRVKVGVSTLKEKNKETKERCLLWEAGQDSHNCNFPGTINFVVYF